jgi:hypothetical protein
MSQGPMPDLGALRSPWGDLLTLKLCIKGFILKTTIKGMCENELLPAGVTGEACPILMSLQGCFSRALLPRGISLFTRSKESRVWDLEERQSQPQSWSVCVWRHLKHLIELFYWQTLHERKVCANSCSLLTDEGRMFSPASRCGPLGSPRALLGHSSNHPLPFRNRCNQNWVVLSYIKTLPAWGS